MPKVAVSRQVVAVAIDCALAVMVPRCHAGDGEVVQLVDVKVVGHYVLPFVVDTVSLVYIGKDIGVCALRRDATGVVVEV